MQVVENVLFFFFLPVLAMLSQAVGLAGAPRPSFCPPPPIFLSFLAYSCPPPVQVSPMLPSK